jgi:hypothetical protein
MGEDSSKNITKDKREAKNMDAVISLEQAKKHTYNEEKLSRQEELKRFFNLNVLDYAELGEDKSGINEFEDAFINYDDVTKRSEK